MNYFNATGRLRAVSDRRVKEKLQKKNYRMIDGQHLRDG